MLLIVPRNTPLVNEYMFYIEEYKMMYLGTGRSKVEFFEQWKHLQQLSRVET